MCYPCEALVSLRDLAVHRTWYGLALQQAHVAVDRVDEQAGGGGGGGGGGSVKHCLCSPTRHPGSFRCRQHHAEYVWGGGAARNNKSGNN